METHNAEINGKKEKILRIITLMLDEVKKADAKYPNDKMSLKEIKSSFLTLKCEVGELEREVSRITKRPELIKKEAIQCMAMAFKFLRDVCFIEEAK